MPERSVTIASEPLAPEPERRGRTPEEAYRDVMGRSLPSAPRPRGAYVPARQHGGLVYVSGQTPHVDGTVRYQGRLGGELDLEDGREAARLALGNLLSALKLEVGALSRVTRLMQLTGYVRSADGFTQHTEVVDAASELLLLMFGEAGRHSRVAVGVNALPRGVAVELALVAVVGEESS